MKSTIKLFFFMLIFTSVTNILAMQAPDDEHPAKRARIESPKTRLRLLHLFDTITLDELKQRYGNHPAVFACDFYIADIEKRGQEIVGGYACENIYNIDHHAPTKRMMSNVTATSLAIDYIKKHGAIPEGSCVLINHTDCDSVLSSLIMCGILLIDEEDDANLYIKAAESADHTGAAHDIADLLQVLAPQRDVTLSAQSMDKLIKGEDLDEKVATLFKKRSEERMRVFALVEQGKLKQKEHVTFLAVTPDQNVDIQLLYWTLPDAEIIMTAGPMPNDASHTGIKIMLGRKAPKGLCLNTVGLGDGFGGRWDAVSNKRAGGTTNSPAIYIDKINAYIDHLNSPQEIE